MHGAEPGLRRDRSADRGADELRCVAGEPDDLELSVVGLYGERAGVPIGVDVQESRRCASPDVRRERRRQRERHRESRLFRCAVEDLADPGLAVTGSGRRCVLRGSRSDQVCRPLVSLVRIRVDADEHASVCPLGEVDRLEVVVGQRDVPPRRVGKHEGCRPPGGTVLRRGHDGRHQERQILDAGVDLEAVDDQQVVALEDLGGAGDEADERSAVRIGARHHRRVRALSVRGLQRLDDLVDVVGRTDGERRHPRDGGRLRFVIGERHAHLDDPAVDVEGRVAVAVLVRDRDVHQTQASFPRVAHSADEG
ncbi:hypothetical protein ACIPEP_02290 [Curtobacterium sp. NPDC087082]|uniref:hypothetical protein n=1 Tax=Curtobacterium sp. NPDC087082 TaxID=3363966 RepID=UPI0037F457B7